MRRTRAIFFVVVFSVLASLGLAASPAAGSASGAAGLSATSSPAVNKGVPKATPDAKTNSAPVNTAKTRPTAAIVLTVQASSPTTYGDTVQLTAVVNLAQVAAGGTVRFIDGGVAIGSSPIDGSGIARMSTSSLRAGKHSLTATYSVGLTTVSTTAVALTVAKRDLHLYANPSRWSRPVGGKNPSYTVEIVPGNETDLVNGDTLAGAVSGKPTFSNSAGPTSPPSIYPITLSGLKSTNYNLVYRTAQFTVYSRDLQVGDNAPDLTAPDQNGTSVSLSSLRGSVVLLDFSAAWCGPSQQLAHDIPTIAAQLSARGIPFSYLPVLVDGPTPGVAATQGNALSYFNGAHLPAGTHVLHVDGSPAALNQPLPAWSDMFHGYGATRDGNNGNLAYPTLAMIDADGVVRDITVGYGDGVDGLVSKLSAIAPDTGVQVTSQPASVTTHRDATVEFTTTNDVPATCSFDGGAFGPCTSPQEFSDLPDGDHTLAISTGAEWPARVTWRVITLDTTITGGPGTGTIPAYEFTGTGVSFVCWSVGETPYPCESGEGIFDLPGGSHTFHVAAVDGFGNVDDTPATATFTTQPLPTITLVPDNPNPSPSDPVTWTVTVTDANSGDPVTGSVVFYGPSNILDEVTLDANGTATHLEPAFFFGYDEFLYFEGDATHGAEHTQVHVNVSP
jgi:hypothetical protein